MNPSVSGFLIFPLCFSAAAVYSELIFPLMASEVSLVNFGRSFITSVSAFSTSVDIISPGNFDFAKIYFGFN